MKVRKEFLLNSSNFQRKVILEIQQPTRKSMYEETHKLVQKMLKTCIFILHGIPNIGVFVPPIVYIIIDVILGRYVAENRIFPLHV